MNRINIIGLFFSLAFVFTAEAQYFASLTSTRLPESGSWINAGAQQLNHDCGIAPIIAYINVLESKSKYIDEPR